MLMPKFIILIRYLYFMLNIKLCIYHFNGLSKKNYNEIIEYLSMIILELFYLSKLLILYHFFEHFTFILSFSSTKMAIKKIYL
jgi:hypothetical protein